MSADTKVGELSVEGFVNQFPLNRHGWIYVIQAIGTERYKIGRSIEPKERLKQLNQRQSPYPLELIYSFWSIDAVKDEQHLHAALADFRVHGEWFEFENDGGLPWLVDNVIPNTAFMSEIRLPATLKTVSDFLSRWFAVLMGKPNILADELWSSVIYAMLSGLEQVESHAQLLFWARFLDYRLPLHLKECDGLDDDIQRTKLLSFMLGAWDALVYFGRYPGGNHEA